MGFSRQECWSGLSFPFPEDLPDQGIQPTSPALAGRFFTTESPGKLSVDPAATAAKSLQSCPTLCDPMDCSLPRLLCPWDCPGKNTGVGCHFLLQCMKVESESEVAQSCLTLSDPVDCSLPGSSIHGIFRATVLEWGAIAFSQWILACAKNVFSNRKVTLVDMPW